MWDLRCWTPTKTHHSEVGTAKQCFFFNPIITTSVMCDCVIGYPYYSSFGGKWNKDKELFQGFRISWSWWKQSHKQHTWEKSIFADFRKSFWAQPDPELRGERQTWRLNLGLILYLYFDKWIYFLPISFLDYVICNMFTIYATFSKNSVKIKRNNNKHMQN